MRRSTEGKADAMDDLRAALSVRIRAARESAGLTQAELATRARLANHASIARIEGGRVLPSLTVWVALCEALRVDPGPLLREVECAACQDAPPRGFSCLACGVSSR